MSAAAATIACTISAQFGPLPGPLPRLRLAMFQVLGACDMDARDVLTYSCRRDYRISSFSGGFAPGFATFSRGFGGHSRQRLRLQRNKKGHKNPI